MEGRGGGIAALALVLIAGIAIGLWVAKSGAFQVDNCDMCGKVAQERYVWTCTPQSANIINRSLKKDAKTTAKIKVKYVFCPDCNETLMGAIDWYSKSKRGIPVETQAQPEPAEGGG